IYNRALSEQEILDLYNAPASPLAIATNSLPDGTVNAAYGPRSLTATGGNPPYIWSLAAGSSPLPDGITLDSNGTISGMPSAAGTSTFTVQVQDTANAIVTKTLSITSSIAPLTVASQVLPSAQVNQPHSQMLIASAGTLPYSWSLLAGNLPLGL